MDDKKDEYNIRSLIKKLIPILMILVVVGVLFVSFSSETFTFSSFNGPGYIPTGYNNTDNQTTDNERLFEYSGNGTFYVGVVKNTSKEDLKDLFHPFDEDPTDINETVENIDVNGHAVMFKVHTMEMNMTELTSGISQLKNQTIPNVSFAKFQATWYCEKSHLTYITTGIASNTQMDEMKIMTQSIKCHQNKSKFILW
jgi:hypothetical protein